MHPLDTALTTTGYVAVILVLPSFHGFLELFSKLFGNAFEKSFCVRSMMCPECKC